MERAPALHRIMEAERRRQLEGVELVPSENYVSAAVLEAMGSILTNKYSEGYPGRRYYGGNENVDDAERLAQARGEGGPPLRRPPPQRPPPPRPPRQSGRLLRRLPTRRPDHGAEPARRRPPHPRLERQHQRNVLQEHPLSRQGRRVYLPRRGVAPGPGGPAAADLGGRPRLRPRVSF